MATRSRDRKKSLIERLRRVTKLYYLKTIRLDDPPEKIARGVAIGVFIGIMPTVGLAMLLSFLLAVLFKANKAAAILGTFVMNPITTPLFWSMSLAVGGLVFWRDTASIFSIGSNFESMRATISHELIVFVTGNIVVATFFGVITYFAANKAITRHKEKKAARLFKRRVYSEGREESRS